MLHVKRYTKKEHISFQNIDTNSRCNSICGENLHWPPPPPA
jgi:hypothetical protein